MGLHCVFPTVSFDGLQSTNIGKMKICITKCTWEITPHSQWCIWNKLNEKLRIAANMLMCTHYNDDVLFHFTPFKMQTNGSQWKMVTKIANSIWNMNAGRSSFDVSNDMCGDTKKVQANTHTHAFILNILQYYFSFSFWALSMWPIKNVTFFFLSFVHSFISIYFVWISIENAFLHSLFAFRKYNDIAFNIVLYWKSGVYVNINANAHRSERTAEGANGGP